MEPIIGQKPATPEGCPYTCPYYLKKGPRVKYTTDMCPRTNDLYARAVMVHLSQWWTARDCANVASAMNKVLGAFYEEAPSGTSWVK
jgi:hypothetical protein